MSVAAESNLKGPLSGITVIDLTRVLAGPYCTMVLSDLGARVIKVELPESGDDARHIGPFIEGKSAYFMSLNRGKESIALNLKKEPDRDILMDLLSKADVLVENYRPGTMEKLELGWEVLHEKFPRLIYAAASGFGHTGPDTSKPAYDMVVQGMGGIMSLTGHEGNPPTRVGSSIGDITAGLFTTIGITSALYHRNLTGEATKIDVAMLDCQVALLENAIARYVASGTAPGPLGSRHPSITPFEAFACRDGHLIIAAGNDRLFGKLMEILDLPHLIKDPRFISNHDRCLNCLILKGLMEEQLQRRDVEEWLAVLEEAGIPCGPINNVADVLSDQQVLARNMVVTVDDPVAGQLKMAGNPLKISGFEDPTTRGAVPDLDGNRDAILKELKNGPSA